MNGKLQEKSERTSRVGVVVVHWGERDVTLRCLQSLRQLQYPDWFLVLVDNGCRAFAGPDVASLVSGSICIQNAENLGYTGGNNIGMREALRAGAEYVWFLNNDAQPEPDALDELMQAATGALRAQSKVERSESKAELAPAIVGAKILRRDDPQRIDSIALRVDLKSGRIYLIGHDEIDRGQYDDWVETNAVTGCAMLVTRTACERLGGFDEDFFAYLEDADLCLRAHQLGWHVVVAPRARVVHDRPAATEGRQSASSLYYTARNHLMLMQRHGRGTGLTRFLRQTVVVTLNVAYAVRVGRGRSLAPLRAVWRGVLDYRRGVSGVGSRGSAELA